MSDMTDALCSVWCYTGYLKISSGGFSSGVHLFKVHQDDTQFHLKYYHLTSVEVLKIRGPSFPTKDLGTASIFPVGFIEPRAKGEGWLFYM